MNQHMAKYTAKTLADLVTPRQLVAIRAIARSKRIDGEDFCKDLFDCKPEELSRKSASILIDKLKAKDVFIGKIVKPTKPHEVASKDC